MEDSSLALMSALDSSGPAAAMISRLWWWMVGVFGAVFVIVMLLLYLGLKMKKKGTTPEPPGGDRSFIVIGGAIIPAFILFGFLIYTLIETAKLKPPKDAITIQVTGHMWWWEIDYPGIGIRTANEIYVPVDTPVRVELQSRDVIHSFWVPSLSGKTDLLPGIKNVHWLEASRPGTYRGQCAEYCGLQHTWMAFYVVALSKEKYQEWVAARMAYPARPLSRDASRGKQVFARAGCAACHAIRGTPFQGEVGPDLTHMGSRLSIAAARVSNNHGNLTGWIANPQAIKPGAKMPATYLNPDELHALATYLTELK